MSPGLIGPQLELAIVSPSTPVAARPCSEADLVAQKERRYRRILARKQKQGDLAGMAACYIRLGDLLLSRGDSEEAGEHYRRALSLSRQAHESRQTLARI
jgi:tetratricopeptide (TPR) repeat protein